MAVDAEADRAAATGAFETYRHLNLLGTLLGAKKVLHAILGPGLGHPSGEVMNRNNKAPGQPANNTGGTDPLEEADSNIRVRSATPTPGC